MPARNKTLPNHSRRPAITYWFFAGDLIHYHSRYLYLYGQLHVATAVGRDKNYSPYIKIVGALNASSNARGLAGFIFRLPSTFQMSFLEFAFFHHRFYNSAVVIFISSDIRINIAHFVCGNASSFSLSRGQSDIWIHFCRHLI